MANKTDIPLIRRMLHRTIELVARIYSTNRLNILMYHQVFEAIDPMRTDEPTRQDFYQQMLLVKKYYNPISVSRAVELLAQNKLPANSICITFDDGYVNNLLIAAPILKQMAIPATVFVATKFSGGENMWNDNIIDLIADHNHSQFDLSLINLGLCFVYTSLQRKQLAQKIIEKIKYIDYEKRLELVSQILLVNGKFSTSAKMMTPQQLRQLAELGIEIAAHTRDHPILAILTKEQQLVQIKQGKEQLEHWLGRKVKGFAYPNGHWKKDYNEVTIELLKQCKFDYAVSTDHGISKPDTNPLQLNRYTPWNKDLLKFHLRLLINTIKQAREVATDIRRDLD